MQKCRRCGLDFDPQNFHLQLGVCHACVKPTDVSPSHGSAAVTPAVGTSYTIPGPWAPQFALNENDEPLRELCYDYRNAATAHAENYFQRIVRWVKQQAVRQSFSSAAGVSDSKEK